MKKEQTFEAGVAAVLDKLREHKPALYPEDVWDETLEFRIGRLAQLVPGDQGKQAADYGMAVISGLHLWNESLDASHTLSQNIHHATGSYWHGIMHRMEGDYSNAKYWFRQTGRHPVFVELKRRTLEAIKQGKAGGDDVDGKWSDMAGQLADGAEWNPYLFVDLVERQLSRERNEAAGRLLEQVQWCEFAALLEYSLEQCGGGKQLGQG